MGRRGWWVTAVALALAACGGGDEPDFAIDPADTEPVRPSSIQVTPTDASITEILSVGVLSSGGAHGRELLDLLLPPAALGEFKVAGAQVDDPNGDGRIDDRWYPPRVKRANCSTSVDAAPIPTASATYVPGRPSDVYDGQSFGDLTGSVEADEIVAVSVQLFDDVEQRDSMADVTAEFYRTSMSVNCPATGTMHLGQVSSLDPLEIPEENSVFHIASFADGLLGVVSVGDRALLSVSVGDGVAGKGGRTPDLSDLEEVIVAMIDRIDAATLP